MSIDLATCFITHIDEQSVGGIAKYSHMKNGKQVTTFGHTVDLKVSAVKSVDSSYLLATNSRILGHLLVASP